MPDKEDSAFEIRIFNGPSALRRDKFLVDQTGQTGAVKEMYRSEVTACYES
jgi:hypothetical protein